ncbi:MAG TPA: hypothetical protein VND21_08565 [Planctomycetota bacterium]|nr:hypothetical protein [Planctomycetota bacterium]
MDCDRFRADRGAGAPLDREGEAHLAACPECRHAVEDVARVERWLTTFPSPVEASPSPKGRERTVQAVLAQAPTTAGGVSGGATVRRRFAVALAVAALVVAGFALGRYMPAGSRVQDDAGSVALAEHEREVFRAIGAGLDEGLGYVATVNGDLVLGLRPSTHGGDLRVVFLELRDASGGVIARPRVVLPDGEEALVRVQGLPDVLVAATRGADGSLRVRAKVRFEDGAEIASAGSPAAPGQRVDLGEVTTRGSRVSVLASAY